MNNKLRKEFEKGFALSTSGKLLAVIDGYRSREIARNELRVFAARLEESAVHSRSKTNLYRIVNASSGMKGIRRLSQSEIDTAAERTDAFLARCMSAEGVGTRPKAVPRRALQHIAQGRCTKVEAVLLLMYSARRISQVKPMQRLKDGERYARFRFAELETISGIPRANLSRALRKLEVKGFLGTVDVAKQNENAYGLCFIDGPLLSLVRRRQQARRERMQGRRKESTTPPAVLDNTPQHETTTLRKGYPKRVPKKSMKSLQENAGHCTQAEWERILLRGTQMKTEEVSQAA